MKNLNKYLIYLLFSGIVIGFFLRLNVLVVTEIDKDEINFFQTSRVYRFREIISGNLWLKDHPPLFMVINRALILMTKDVRLLRLPNLIYYALSLYFLYLIAGFSTKSRVYKLLLPFLFSVSTYFFYQNIHANPYGLAILLFLASNYFLFKIISDKRSDWDTVLFSFFGVLFFLTSYVAYYYFACVGVLLLLRLIYLKKLDAEIVKGGLFIMIGSFNQILIFLTMVGGFRQLTPSYSLDKIKVVLSPVYENLSFLQLVPFDYYTPAATIVLLIILVVWLLKSPKGNYRDFIHLTAIFILVPELALLSFNHFFQFHLTNRALFVTAIGVIYLVWYILINLKSRIAITLASVLIVLSLYSLSTYTQVRKFTIGNIKYKELTKRILNLCEKDKYLVLNSTTYDYFPFVYYYIHGYGMNWEEYDPRKAECVKNNLVVIEDGEIVNEHSTNLSNKKIESLYFLDLVGGVKGQDAIRLIKICRDFNFFCEYVYAADRF